MNRNHLLIPPFPKDETLNSLLERMASYNFGRSLRLECLNLLERTRSFVDTLPSSLSSVCDAFSYSFGDEGGILSDHTLFDFFACGLMPEQVTKLRDRLIKEARGPLRPARLPLLFNTSEQECLHCVDCDELNITRRGFFFTYRQHCAPFVHVCPWHGTSLLPAEGKFRLYDHHCRSNNAGSKQLVLEFAQRSAACVGTNWNSSAYHRRDLLEQLARRGWITENGRCIFSHLLKAFHQKFDDAFGDERLRALCSTSRYAEFALRALLRADRNVHPVWCVLFKWLADATENTTRRNTSKANKQERSSSPNLNEQLEVLRKSPSIRQAATSLRLSPNTLITLAERHGIHVGKRPKRIFGPERKGIADYLCKGMPAAQVAATCDVSLSTVYRVAASSCEVQALWPARRTDQKLQVTREAWLHVLRRYPTLTVTELRSRCAAEWFYLYRHDRQWLAQHSPRRERLPKSRKNSHPEQLYALATKSLAAASEKCIGAEVAPVRTSAYRMQALTGLSEYALIPFLSPREDREYFLPESHCSFIRRRLTWLRSATIHEEPMANWRLAKRAGVRLSSIMSISIDEQHHAVEVAGASKALWQQFYQQSEITSQNLEF